MELGEGDPWRSFKFVVPCSLWGRLNTSDWGSPTPLPLKVRGDGAGMLHSFMRSFPKPLKSGLRRGAPARRVLAMVWRGGHMGGACEL